MSDIQITSSNKHTPVYSYMLQLMALFGIVAVTGCSDSLKSAEEAGLTALNTYSCACTCKAKKGGFSSYEYTEVVDHQDGITVSAQNEQQAKNYCAYQCATQREDDINKNIKWTSDYVDVGPCTVSSVLNKDTGVSSKANSLQSIRPRTATFEGPVDSGASFVEMKSEDGDYVKAFVKGYVSISGGNCIGQSCSATVNSVDLVSKDDALLSSNGNTIKNFKAINEGLWQGTKDSSDAFKFGQASEISISADVGEKHLLMTTGPENFIMGKLLFGKPRMMPGRPAVKTNALIIDGDFVDGAVEVKIHFHIWLTNCQPVVTANAICWGGIDGQGRFVWLSYKAKKLGYLKGGDLCAVINASDANDVCTPGGTVEFPTFSCGEEPNPLPSDPAAISKYLDFRWRDAHGRVISKDPSPLLSYMPQFPVSMVVENEWGRTATSIISNPPSGIQCPHLVLKLDPGSFRWDPASTLLSPELLIKRLRPTQ